MNLVLVDLGLDMVIVSQPLARVRVLDVEDVVTVLDCCAVVTDHCEEVVQSAFLRIVDEVLV